MDAKAKGSKEPRAEDAKDAEDEYKDEPQMDQPSSGSRGTMVGRLQIRQMVGCTGKSSLFPRNISARKITLLSRFQR